jgi:hypothetical protein
MDRERKAQAEVADKQVHRRAGDQTELGHRPQPAAGNPRRDRFPRSRQPGTRRVLPPRRVLHPSCLGLYPLPAHL